MLIAYLIFSDERSSQVPEGCCLLDRRMPFSRFGSLSLSSSVRTTYYTTRMWPCFAAVEVVGGGAGGPVMTGSAARGLWSTSFSKMPTPAGAPTDLPPGAESGQPEGCRSCTTVTSKTYWPQLEVGETVITRPFGLQNACSVNQQRRMTGIGH